MHIDIMDAGNWDPVLRKRPHQRYECNGNTGMNYDPITHREPLEISADSYGAGGAPIGMATVEVAAS